ncbi:uncharacterized protein ALTATR162_LOCUS11946 [Alternaria atra]|uniref:Uncharacterized protein n=1 Tax=Alternaria atra TaxID=119953 RepID=A0A8J2N604_9PLEO|nr:uncharacterized protein ALTATR162_LOCUS11946 [Alternaria atra]CAG5188381.1 unnamed protein product [Alternaria atra]
MNFETPSKIVKLRVGIPEDHFIDGPSEGQTVREQSPEIMPLQSVSSRPTPSACPLASSGSNANADAKSGPTSHASGRISPIDSKETIDRFLELESQHHTLLGNLDRHQDRISDLRRQFIGIRIQIEAKRHAVRLLLTEKRDQEAAKKRIWDAMSKEDIRELGRRDSLTKRFKHG